MTTNILILCTHNSARSVLAEAMLNHEARRLSLDVQAFSAGSAPGGRVHPLALQVLERAGVDTSACRSKSWDEFAGDAAPRMRVVITVCDAAAAEACPYWPGSPVTVHWGYADPSADPSAAPEAERVAAFEATRQAIGARMQRLLQLPIDSMSDAELRQALDAIARASQ